MHPSKRRSRQFFELTAEIYQRDLRFRFSRFGPSNFLTEEERERKKAKRSKIIKFSWRSGRRLRHLVRNTEDIWTAFITLTYPENFPLNGRKVKAHLNAFLQYLRRRKIKFIWILEFQMRGAPHYHVIISDEIPKDEVAERWYRIVGSGDGKHLRAGTRIERIRSKNHLHGHLSNYIKKSQQKEVPEGFKNVGRFWGSSRSILVHEGFEKIGHFYELLWSIKLIRNWYKAHLRKFGIKWRWKGKGFIALDGVLLMNQIMSLRV